MGIGITITNLGRAQLSVQAWRKGLSSWWDQFESFSESTAKALKSKAESWSPVDKGDLERAGMTRKLIPYSDWLNRVYTIHFTPEYADWIENAKWGPDAGNDFRKRTAAKMRRLGTPIGPHFVRRSTAAFNRDLEADQPILMTGLPNLGIKIRSKASVMKKGMIFA